MNNKMERRAHTAAQWFHVKWKSKAPKTCRGCPHLFHAPMGGSGCYMLGRYIVSDYAECTDEDWLQRLGPDYVHPSSVAPESILAIVVRWIRARWKP
jgi:hypothetical protein